MITKLKKLALTSGALFALLSPLAVSAVVSAATPAVPTPTNGADIRGQFCTGVDISVANGGDCANVAAAEGNVNDLVKLGINLFSAVVGIIAVVMIIVGGIKYITSGGDTSNVTAAKNTILFAVVGLIVVALAQIIVRFVLNRFTGAGATPS